MDLAAAQSLTEKLYRRLTYRRPEIDRFEAYYRGAHSLVYASEQWAKQHAARYKGFSDNWCAVVANAPAERIQNTGIMLPGGDGARLSDQERVLSRAMKVNDWDAQQSQGVLTAITSKRSYVMVWGDSEGQPIITWEHPSFVEIDYDDENPRLRTSAIRTWRDDKIEYANLYTPTDVWKFQRPLMRPDSGAPKSELDRLTFTGFGWVPRLVGAEPWPVVNPIGVVPIVEVPNRPMLRGEPLSDIAGVITMQDAINLLWAYLFVAADHASMAARIISGAEAPVIPLYNDAGELIGEKPVKMDDLAADRLLFLTGDNVKTSQWDAARLDVFTSAIEFAVGHISAQSRTPGHYLVTGGTLANIDSNALIAAESGLAMKCQEFILHATPAIREVNVLTAKVIGDKKLIEAAKIGEPIWSNVHTRDEAQRADALVKKASIGYPLEYLLQLDGLTQAEISDVLAMKERESADPSTDAIIKALGAGNGGNPTVGQ